MTRPIRLAILAILSVTVAVAAALPFLLPPRALQVPDSNWAGTVPTVRGGYHVHSTISDGTGSLDQIAAAAAAAGLQFVIVTDHGDGTRQAEPPQYRSGVLLIEGVEINTSGGHLVALGLRPSAYPLAGAPRAVIEDVHRLGGIGIAAHPGSPRTSLKWTDWSVPLDGIEWLNADSEWRDEFVESLGRMLLTYPFRPAETLASMLDRPDPVMAQWDQLAVARRVAGFAGADAHARLGFRQQDDPYEDRWHVALPSYESSFRTFSTRLVLDAPLSGDAPQDAADILRCLRMGRFYSVVDGIASPGALDFRATSGGAQALVGDDLDIGEAVEFHIRAAAPAGARMVLLRNGEPYYETRGPDARVNIVRAAGAYRVELYAPAATARTSIPWMVSNPIYVGLREAHRQATELPGRPPAGERGGVATERWTSEASPGSTSRLQAGASVDGVPGFEWEFRLQDGVPAGQFAAVGFPVEGGLAGRDRVQLRARTDRPMRAWVQVRASSVGEGDRWGQSVYLDSEPRMTDLFFDDFVPMGRASTPRPPLDKIDSLLLVVDTVNTRPGTTGGIHIAEAWLASPAR